MAIDGTWSTGHAGTEGQAGGALIWLSLRWLADVGEAPPFAGPRGERSASEKKLFAHRKVVAALLKDEDVLRLLSDGPGAKKDRDSLRQSLGQTRDLIAKVWPGAAIEAWCTAITGGRPRNTPSDAALVLLAGCWWVATGTWPSTPKVVAGSFFNWTRATLMRLRPDLGREVVSEVAIQKALKRCKAVTGEGGGPWLALAVRATETS
jgi:hypothetical protein